LDAPKLDKLYEQVAVKMSTSYRKVNALLDEGKTAEAAKEFKSSFSPQVKKFYSEAALTAPKRYLEDCEWNAKAKSLYITTRKAEKALTKGDLASSQKLLDELREFFFKLHRTNKLQLTNDAVYELFKLARQIPEDNAKLAKFDASKLAALKSKIRQANPSMKVKANQDGFKSDYEKWSAEVDELLAQNPLDTQRADKLKSITESFYKEYGMDFE